MSLKSIEMQFALHKNDEAGIRQQHMMQKPVSDQSLLAADAHKDTIRERAVSGKTEETNQAAIRDGGRSTQGKTGKAKSRRKKDSPEEMKEGRAPDHPFKGLHIDLSL